MGTPLLIRSNSCILGSTEGEGGGSQMITRGREGSSYMREAAMSMLVTGSKKQNLFLGLAENFIKQKSSEYKGNFHFFV